MKANVFILLFVFYSSECRKVYQPLDKNANLDFINMESGGARRGPNQQSVVQPQPKTPSGPPQPSNQPAPGQASNPSQPTATAPKPVAVPSQTTLKPQITPQTTPASKSQAPNQIKPVPVNPTPATNPITTPGYGTVKQLVNFYDSQGKGSPIRPYSYSQAVKQG
ncbi:hypothetical protein K1T71_001837 [Dendrolimus kikuchii]|uniref:Uncharacterized protein n=1 Tax=Dendrolimus kikuchii TaxID=765133 RepID=A0ACC1DET5_9NEOP|nr:hypothetical protein K1T71_001837 [Dendrolimus kikuchii]